MIFNRNGAFLRKLSILECFLYTVCSQRTSHKIQASAHVRIFLRPTVIVNGTKECLSFSLERRYDPKKLRRRLKPARGLDKLLYYIKVCLLRSPPCDLGNAILYLRGCFSQAQSHASINSSWVGWVGYS